jgi:hypothetical protein
MWLESLANDCEELDSLEVGKPKADDLAIKFAQQRVAGPFGF